MKTFGPATSFFTSCSDLPQNEQRSEYFILRVKSLSGDSVPVLKRIAFTLSLRLSTEYADGPELLAVRDYFVNQAVLFGLHRRHNFITLHVALDCVVRLTRVLCYDL